jgi:hypothetical protein
MSPFYNMGATICALPFSFGLRIFACASNGASCLFGFGHKIMV